MTRPVLTLSRSGVYDTSSPDHLIPLVVRTKAKIAGILFGLKTTIYFDVSDGRTLDCSASPELVDSAMSLCGGEVIIMSTLLGNTGRLLWIGTSPPESMSREKRSAYVLSEWRQTLDELFR